MEFKPGDFVKVVDTEYPISASAIKIGDVYIIMETSADFVHIKVNGSLGGYFSTRFEKITMDEIINHPEWFAEML